MADSSLEYWKQREREAKAQAIRDADEYNARLREIYKYTADNIERTVNDWYARYATKNHITMADARARVRNLDMKRYEKLAAKYVRERDLSAQANEEMEIYNLTMRINRLELLRAQINLELMAGYDDIEKEMERDLIEAAMKEDRRLAGILGDSVIGNERYAKELVNASFRNATFSERLWGNNMPALRTHLEAELRNGLIQGIHPRELARRFRQHYGGSVKDTERLMVTEMRRLQTSVQKESFERNGFREYTFITTGDERVCEDCDALNGQHFKVSEMQPGENAPPMHPSCRCSTAAWMDGDKYKRWIDALASGEDVRWNEFEAEEKKPPTLSNFDEHEKEWLNNHFDFLSEPLKEYMRSSLQTMFDNGQYHMAMRADTLSKVIESGEIKSVIEVDEHDIMVSARKKVTQLAFGCDTSKLKNNEYEKYGYLGNTDFLQDASEATALSSYGDTILRFKKDGLKDRVTYTYNDSYGMVLAGDSIAGRDGDNVSIAGIDTIERRTKQIMNTLLTSSDSDMKNPNKMAHKFGSAYIELQYHGDLLLDDIDSVCFTEKNVDSALVKKLKAMEIKVYHVNGKNLAEI